ncbi:MAG: SDR family NAD(P)-dependent oxidoreductase, partial [Dehalococcoidia bacterium]
MSEKRLEGQVAVVTGASRGIGRACAEELAREGATVVINYNQSPEPAEQLAKQVNDAGGKAMTFKAHVGNADEAKALVDKAVETFGQIDILVNNAGVNRDRTLKRLSVAEW